MKCHISFVVVDLCCFVTLNYFFTNAGVHFNCFIECPQHEVSITVANGARLPGEPEGRHNFFAGVRFAFSGFLQGVGEEVAPRTVSVERV